MYRAQSRRHSFPSPMGHGFTTNHETKAHRTHTTGLLPAQCTHHTSSTTTCRLRQSPLGQDTPQSERERASAVAASTLYTHQTIPAMQMQARVGHATQCSDVQGRNSAPLRARERAASHAPRLFGANTRAWPPCGFQACHGHPSTMLGTRCGAVASSYRTERFSDTGSRNTAAACVLAWSMQQLGTGSYTPYYSSLDTVATLNESFRATKKGALLASLSRELVLHTQAGSIYMVVRNNE